MLLPLAAVLADALERECARIFNLGDLGGFGADINGVWPLLERYEVESIAGYYDIALGFDQPNCGCGYTDADDRREAQEIYDLTHAAVDSSFARWMQSLPGQLRLDLGGQDVLMVHGSPIEVNDFLWESLSDDEIRRRLDAVPGERPAVMLCSHTGIPWQRRIDGTLVVNVGAVGKPPNNGSPDVAYPRSCGINAERVYRRPRTDRFRRAPPAAPGPAGRGRSPARRRGPGR